MRFGIIGTVCSRTEEHGKEFASKDGVSAVYTDMAEMFQSGDIDAVYIASPNSFHVEQSTLAWKKAPDPYSQ